MSKLNGVFCEKEVTKLFPNAYCLPITTISFYGGNETLYEIVNVNSQVRNFCKTKSEAWINAYKTLINNEQ